VIEILLIAHDDAIRELGAELLRDEVYMVATAASASDGLAQLEQATPSALLVDVVKRVVARQPRRADAEAAIATSSCGLLSHSSNDTFWRVNAVCDLPDCALRSVHRYSGSAGQLRSSARLARLSWGCALQFSLCLVHADEAASTVAGVGAW
jgi:hypothetical protein